MTHLSHARTTLRHWYASAWYDRLWQPGSIAQKVWVKTRGYPLPKALIPAWRATTEYPAAPGITPGTVTQGRSTSSYWTPLGAYRCARYQRRHFPRATTTWGKGR